MKPWHSEEAIRQRLRRRQESLSGLHAWPLLKVAWKEIAGVLGFVGALAAALVALGRITPGIHGILVIATLTVFAAVIGGILVNRLIRRERHKVKPTIYLDQVGALNTIDDHFKVFEPTGDILILQTWIPQNPPVPKAIDSTARIRKWEAHLIDAVDRYRKDIDRVIHLKVLLAGSEEILRNRLRFRWDVARDYGAPFPSTEYPLPEKQLDQVVADKKRHISTIANDLFYLRDNIDKHIYDKQGQRDRFRVLIGYYTVTPCGPLYVFGQKALLAGFYDHRWTSDLAPTIRLDNPNSAEWAHFVTQFECIWQLSRPDPRNEKKSEPTTDHQR
jgi:hypothetical protein